MRKLLLLLGLMFVPLLATGTTITKPYTFTGGIIYKAHVNADFDVIYTFVDQIFTDSILENTFGGTGKNTAASSGFPFITAGVWSVITTGTSSQYLRGDGTLGLAPTGSGTSPFTTVSNVVMQDGTYSDSTTDDFVFGSKTLTYDAQAGRFFFDKSKAAFWAGYWDSSVYDTVGNYSANFGYRNKATGANSFAMGSTNTVSGTQSSAIGYNNTVSAASAFAVGSTNTITSTGTYSFISGFNNSDTGVSSAIFGNSNSLSSDYCLVSGYGNTVASKADYSVVLGQSNTVNSGAGYGESYAIGKSNNLTGNLAFAFGYDNTVGTNSVAIGLSNTVSGLYATATGISTTSSGVGSFTEGIYSKSALQGQHAQASGRFAANGDAQYSRLVLYCSTNSDTSIMGFDGIYPTVPANTSWAFTGTICGRTDADSAVAYEIKGLITRNGANTTTLVTSTVTAISSAAIVGANVTILADDTDEYLKVSCFATPATRWVCSLHLTECGF